MKAFSKLNWLNPKIVIINSEHCGRGQMATEAIQKDELLVVYGGHVMTMEEMYALPPELQEFNYQISDEPELVYGPSSLEELQGGEFFNHSCNPNTGFKSEIHLVAMKDIRAGEELTFDYAICTTSDYSNMHCRCGAENCRGYIKGDDWKIPTLQHKYRGYFQPYIAEKIAKLTD